MEFESYADVIDSFERDDMGYGSLTDYINGENIKIKEIEMDPMGDLKKALSSKKDGGLMVAIQKFNQGGNVIDSRATVEDMAKSIQSSSAATNDQKLQLLMDYDNANRQSQKIGNYNPANLKSGLFTNSNQTAMEKLLGLQTNPNFQYTSPMGPMMIMPPTRSTGFRQDPGYFGNEGIMINGKRYMSEDEAIDDMGVETYNRFMADGGMAGDKTYHQFHDQYVPMDEESMGYAYGGGVGSMMQPRMNFAGGGMDYEPLGYNEDESITVEDLTVPSRVGDFRVSASKPLNDQSGIISAATNIMSPGVNTIEGSLIDGDDPSSRYGVQQDFPSTIDRFSNSVAPVPPGVITDRNRGMNNIGPATEIDTFSENFDKNYDASSDALVPGMGKKAIDFIDAPVNFMMRANNPNVFDPVVNTKNFVQDGITNITDYAKKNLTPKNIATSAIGGKVASIFGLPAVLGGFLARSLFGNKNEFEGPFDDINNDGVIDRFDKAKTLFGRSKTFADYFEAKRQLNAQQQAINRAETREIQGRVDRQENDINRQASKNDSKSGASTVNPNSAYGKSKGYTGGNPNPHTDTGWSGSSKNGGSGNKGGGNKGGGGGYTGGGFCFDPNTLVQMANGSEKKIKDIQLGDNTKGGEVTGVFQFKAADEIHDYKGVTVAGSHYVKEDGRFIMVQDSPLSVKIDKIPVVYSLDTTGRRIFINDIEFADYNGDGVAKNFLSNAGVDLTGFDTEVLRQVEHRLI